MPSYRRQDPELTRNRVTDVTVLTERRGEPLSLFLFFFLRGVGNSGHAGTTCAVTPVRSCETRLHRLHRTQPAESRGSLAAVSVTHRLRPVTRCPSPRARAPRRARHAEEQLAMMLAADVCLTVLNAREQCGKNRLPSFGSTAESGLRYGPPSSRDVKPLTGNGTGSHLDRGMIPVPFDSTRATVGPMRAEAQRQ